MAAVRVRVAWDKGGEAVLERLAGELVMLSSTVPSPPGSRIEGAVTIESEGANASAAAGPPLAKLRVKVHASRRRDDGAFVLEGRALDLTRELRERLGAAIAPREE